MKNRPSTIFTLSCTASASSETPRSCTFASVPVFCRGSAAITTTSGLTSGPSAPRMRLPRASSMACSCSRVTALSISEVAPARRTIALCSDPERDERGLEPAARASMATNTPTRARDAEHGHHGGGQRTRTLSKL